MSISLPDPIIFVSKDAPQGVSREASSVMERVRGIAAALEERGVRRGDRIAIWLSSAEQQLMAILGCWMLGAAFCVLPSFAGRQTSDRAKGRVDEVLSVLAPRALIQTKSRPLEITQAEGFEVLFVEDVPHGAVSKTEASFAFPSDDEQLAFVQFTSGSTGGKAKGAEVRFGQLKSNLHALGSRIGMSRDDRMVTWTPLYHDMGLMAVIFALHYGADLVLMDTDHFVRRPTAWLEAISRYRGTVTNVPPTALKLLTHRKTKDIDLSSLRHGWVGGEAVFPSTLQEFTRVYRPFGLGQYVMQPSYGMAEAVVGVACGESNAPWRVKDEIVSCGRTIDGMEVQIADDAGNPVAEERVGRVLVRGESVISGYLGLPRFEKGSWYDTGDIGFLSDGHVYVSGRAKDVLKRGAESFPAHLIEASAEDALGLRTGRAAAFANFRPDLAKEEIVLLVEARDWNQDHARVAAAAVLQELGLQIDVIRAVNGGRLPRTSSGKLMRQAAAAQYREGKI